MLSENDTTGETVDEQRLRQRALTRLKRRRDFRVHLLMYLMVNAFLVVIWWATIGWGGFFWPAFPLVGWGIGLVAHWYDVYYGEDFTEAQIRAEMDRLQRR